MSLFDLAPRMYEVFGLAANLLRDGNQVRLVRFEEAKQRGEQFRVAGPGAQLIGPNSGQVEEPLRPTLVTERCRERGEGERHRIVWV